MKKTIVFAAIIIALGALIALGPKFLFPVCDVTDMSEGEIEVTCCGPGAYPRCTWTAQAEIGIGMLIAALGLCMLVFNDPKTQISFAAGTFFAGLVAIAVPYLPLIGGCESPDMPCHMIAFPALAVEGILLMAVSAVTVFMLIRKQ